MNGLMKKAGLGIALAATALTAAAPADAQRWGRYRHYDRGGNGAATALLGGIVGLGIGAAIASNNNRNRYYDRGYDYDAPPRVTYRDRYTTAITTITGRAAGPNIAAIPIMAIACRCRSATERNVGAGGASFPRRFFLAGGAPAS